MISSTRSTVIARIGAALLVGPLLAAVPGQAAAADDCKRPVQASDERKFTWDRDIRVGDCTMFAGATWSLRRDGWARFTGKVTSSDSDDAWLMYAELYRNGRHVDNIAAQQTGVDNIHRFVMNLDSDRQTEWDVCGTYRPELFGDPNFRIDGIRLRSHC